MSSPGGAYACDSCSASFASPNPLKLHLASRCGRVAPQALWARLVQRPHAPAAPQAPWFTPLLLPSTPSTPITASSTLLTPSAPTKGSPSHTVSPVGSVVRNLHDAFVRSSVSPGSIKPVSPDSTSSSRLSPPPESPEPPMPQQEPRSAFRRVSTLAKGAAPAPHLQGLYQSSSLMRLGMLRGAVRTPLAGPLALAASSSSHELFFHPRQLLSPLIPTRPPHAPTSAPSPLAPGLQPLLPSLPPASVGPVDACAEMETLVSNLGRSRRGHLCLYCGKVSNDGPSEI